MEFWGVEVKPGKPLKVTPEVDTRIHISQASLGVCPQIKKGESVLLHVNVGDRKLVLGTLVSETIPQISCGDLVLHEEFELSHNSETASVHYTGFKCPITATQEREYFTDSTQVHPTATANMNDEDESDDDNVEWEVEEEDEKVPPTHTANSSVFGVDDDDDIVE